MKYLLILSFLTISNVSHAYYGQTTSKPQDNSLSARHLRGEISTNDYLDSKLGKMNCTQYGTIYHSDGSQSYYTK